MSKYFDLSALLIYNIDYASKEHFSVLLKNALGSNGFPQNGNLLIQHIYL